MGAPFLGSVKALKLQLGLPASFNSIKALGMRLEIAYDLIKTISGFYSLFPRFIDPEIQDQDWYKELINRVNADRIDSVYKSTNKVINLFPLLDQKCYEYLKFREFMGCTIGIDPDFNHFGKILEIEIDSKDNLRQAIHEYINYKMALPLYNTSIDKRIEKLQNPNVEVTSVYGNFLATESKLFYQRDPLKRSQEGKPYEPEEVDFSYGDGTVTTASAIIPPLKWANDYEEKKKGSKPVVFIEIC